MNDRLFINNDYDLSIPDLRKQTDGSPLTSATVTCTLKDGYSATAATLGGPVTLTPNGSGGYAGVLEAAAFGSLALNATVYLWWSASQGGYDASWIEARRVAYRPAGA